MENIKFHREVLTTDWFVEAAPLNQGHFDEVKPFPEFSYQLNQTLYFQLQESGTLRLFTARTDTQLVGYAVFFLHPDHHCKSCLQAIQDALYIHPDRRGYGREFIQFCDNQLRNEGVDLVYHHVPSNHNFGKVLERIGYQLVDYVYGKKLQGD